MNIVYAPRAIRDLEAIATYLTDRSPSGTINVLGAIKSTIETLSFFPLIGRQVDEMGIAAYRYHVIRTSSSIASTKANC